MTKKKEIEKLREKLKQKLEESEAGSQNPKVQTLSRELDIAIHEFYLQKEIDK
ncbi:Spo0E family sporulation regulatory protein-aspartic acid phosphatase [Natroniella acetigena]|uniref:Spo0E family sporulation regulatory protein-aspartic acid phosphatase n=1 Tax=Natroniella acetigena TaxID=52004 RepID=UPI00200B48F9|nr:Spo0E family sporulation regulatory protein-aspartic acid phosphatase [Natroniella acetigena]MCK8828527.1 Spo0E family sporulation regulatory protein-aspartic acid phosphatase [Natroniella acetigena]